VSQFRAPSASWTLGAIRARVLRGVRAELKSYSRDELVRLQFDGIEFLGRDAQIWGLDLDENCAGIWASKSER
jgi:hypothetical protein